MNGKQEFYVTPAIKVEQPLGVFYVAAIKADVLQQVAFSVATVAVRGKDGSYEPGKGTQRVLNPTRIKEIGNFIETVEATFPNSIILGANYVKETGQLVKESKDRWYIESVGEDLFRLHIPSNAKLASIIDGQHRLEGFTSATRNKAMPLLCAVFLDLPFPYHAYVFATINYNQKSVPKSLAYELFGFELDEKESESWPPEMLAVYLTRIFESSDEHSPLKEHIKLGIVDEKDEKSDGNWQVSLATIVDGILSLISASPKKDRDAMHKFYVGKGRVRKDLKEDETRPLRHYYLKGNDAAIYSIVNNYFMAVDDLMWAGASEGSYIKKTVGVQALFDVLRMLLISEKNLTQETASVNFFKNCLVEAAKIRFEGPHFEASGIGKSVIKNLIATACGLQGLDDIQTKREEIADILTQFGVAIRG